MDSLHLIEYMAWVPIVGSAFGNVLGGFISDYFIGKQADKEQEERMGRESEGSRSPLLDSSRSSSPLPEVPRNSTFGFGSAHTGAEDEAGGDNGNGDWDGNRCGQNASVRLKDQSVRMLIAGWSNIIPIPLVVCALLVEFPYCFLIMIISGMVSI